MTEELEQPASRAAAAPNGSRVAWLVAEHLLLTIWVAAAALNLMHRRAGFLTNHAADLTIPAWLYVSGRSSSRSSPFRWRRALAAASPWVLASVFFAASAATEVSQYFRPNGILRGTFDPLDIAAYGAGLVLVALADDRWPIPSRGGAGSD